MNSKRKGRKYFQLNDKHVGEKDSEETSILGRKGLDLRIPDMFSFITKVKSMREFLDLGQQFRVFT